MARPWQWQSNGGCVDTRDGSFVDKDACEGTFDDWKMDQAMASTYTSKVTGKAPTIKLAGGRLPKWALPAAGAVTVIGLFLYLKK